MRWRCWTATDDAVGSDRRETFGAGSSTGLAPAAEGASALLTAIGGAIGDSGVVAVVPDRTMGAGCAGFAETRVEMLSAAGAR